MKARTLGLLAVAMLAGPMAANAAVVWTVNNALFDDGTAITGSFTYDAAAGTYGAYNLSVAAGSFLPAYNYLPDVDAGFVGLSFANRVDFVALPLESPERYVRFSFAVPLTDLGGTVNLGIDGSSWECNNCAETRFIVSGYVTGVPSVPDPVPLPAAAWLLLSGLGGLGFLRKRKAA